MGVSLDSRPDRAPRHNVARRDRIAAWLCNAVLRTVATPRYRKFVAGAIAYGLASAARDESEGREAPEPSWLRA